jgi:hypothetical protein
VQFLFALRTHALDMSALCLPEQFLLILRAQPLDADAGGMAYNWYPSLPLDQAFA